MTPEGVGVGRQLRERDRLRRRPTRAAVATMVVVHEAGDVPEWIECLAKLRVVDAEPAVHDETWEPGSHLAVEELHTREPGERHQLGTAFSASPSDHTA